MKNFIGVVFLGIVFSFILIPLIDAGPSDIWKECTYNTTVFRLPTPIEGKYCCVANSSSFEWLDDSDKKILCKPPAKPTVSASDGWKKTNFDVSITYSAANGLSECYYKVFSNGVQTVSTFPGAWQPIPCSGLSDTKIITLTVGDNGNCKDVGQDKCEIQAQAYDGLNTGETSVNNKFSVDWKPPTTTIDTPVNGATYSAATMPASFSGKIKDNDANGIGLFSNIARFYVKKAVDNVDYYWDGSTWSSTLTWLPTAHNATTGGIEVTWTNSSILPSWTDGTYYVKPWGIDSIGNAAEGGETSFIYDTTPPLRTNGYPTGTTVNPILIGLATDESAICKYSTVSGQAYGNMPSTFLTTGGKSHSESLGNLAATDYTYYVKCMDSVGNKNSADCPSPGTDCGIISFAVCARTNPTVSVSPKTTDKGEPGQKLDYEVSVKNNDVNCGAETFDLTAVCPAGWTCSLPSTLSVTSDSSAKTTLSVTSSSSATTGTYSIPVTTKNKNDATFKASDNANYEIVCIYRLSIKPMTNFDKATKHGKSTTVQAIWSISIQDTGSSTSCPLVDGKLEYELPSLTISNPAACHSQTGIYSGLSTPPGGIKLPLPFKFSIARNGDSDNAFKVFVKRQTSDFCTISFNILPTQPGTLELDPSFTVGSSEASTQPPHIGFFAFSGDTAAFSVNWEAFYPDDPFRTMNVKCGLNCDPQASDCDKIAGKGCIPYPVQHGTETIKKGGCVVSSPAYNFATDKIMCLFYDPNNPSLNTPVNKDIAAVDFDVRTVDKITITVGKQFDIKIDVVNKGVLEDNYKMELLGPESVSIFPSIITTPVIGANQLLSTFSSITPLVDETETVILKVTSMTSGKIIQKEITLSPNFLTLPEFGLAGFLQIVAVAAVIYFLIANKNKFKPKKRRR